MITELYRLGFEPLLNNLPYGNAAYAEKTNQKAFLIIQQFVKDTGNLVDCISFLHLAPN